MAIFDFMKVAGANVLCSLTVERKMSASSNLSDLKQNSENSVIS